jgi:hypothetical protein
MGLTSDLITPIDQGKPQLRAINQSIGSLYQWNADSVGLRTFALTHQILVELIWGLSDSIGLVK